MYHPEPSSNSLPNKNYGCLCHSLLSTDENYDGKYGYSSYHPTRACSHKRVDDGLIYRHSEDRGTYIGTTLKYDVLKPLHLR